MEFSRRQRHSSEELLETFTKLAESFATLARQWGTTIRPYRHPELPLLSQIPFERQLQAIDRLRIQLEIFSAEAMTGNKVEDQRRIVWAALKRFGFVPPPDFFEKLAGDDIVELYDESGLQIFSNFRFYDFCSYSIEELAAFDWMELWARDEDAVKEVASAIQNALTSDSRETMVMNCREQRIVERHSPLRYELSYRMKYIAPVRQRSSSRPCGVLAIESGVLLSGLSTVEEEARLLSQPFELGG